LRERDWVSGNFFICQMRKNDEQICRAIQHVINRFNYLKF